MHIKKDYSNKQEYKEITELEQEYEKYKEARKKEKKDFDFWER